jgi:hypothetical protein
MATEYGSRKHHFHDPEPAASNAICMNAHTW